MVLNSAQVHDVGADADHVHDDGDEIRALHQHDGQSEDDVGDDERRADVACRQGNNREAIAPSR